MWIFYRDSCPVLKRICERDQACGITLSYASFSVSPLINRLITFQSNLVPSLQDLKKTRLCEEYSCWTASKMVHWCCTMDATVSRSPNNKERQKRCILNSFSFSSKPQKATERPLSLHLHCPSCVRLDDEMQVHLHSGCTGNYSTLMILMDREMVMGPEVYFEGPFYKHYWWD